MASQVVGAARVVYVIRLDAICRGLLANVIRLQAAGPTWAGSFIYYNDFVYDVVCLGAFVDVRRLIRHAAATNYPSYGLPYDASNLIRPGIDGVIAAYVRVFGQGARGGFQEDDGIFLRIIFVVEDRLVLALYWG